jgi:hypothetical protein
MNQAKKHLGVSLLVVSALLAWVILAQAPASTPRAWINGTGPGWVELTEADFVNVNCDPDTWSWREGMLHCTGEPIGVIRTKEQYSNFELVVEWRHLTSGGNSGVFAWASDEALRDLPRGDCRSPWYIPHLGVEFTKVIPPGRFHGNSPTLLPR